MSTELHTLRMNAELPTLYIPWPQCGHCFKDVTIEDGAAWCEGCLVQWDRIEEDREASPDENKEGTEVQCQIVVGKAEDPHDDERGRHYEPGPPEPCILPSGHEGAHLCPYPVVVTKAVEA